MAETNCWVITPIGGIGEHTLEKPITVAQLRRWVGGYVELLPQGVCGHYKGQRAQFWVNEDGKQHGLPRNALASRTCNIANWGFAGDYISGTMVIVVGKALAK